jgi:hypothetical protein
MHYASITTYFTYKNNSREEELTQFESLDSIEAADWASQQMGEVMFTWTGDWTVKTSRSEGESSYSRHEGYVDLGEDNNGPVSVEFVIERESA